MEELVPRFELDTPRVNSEAPIGLIKDKHQAPIGLIKKTSTKKTSTKVTINSFQFPLTMTKRGWNTLCAAALHKGYKTGHRRKLVYFRRMVAYTTKAHTTKGGLTTFVPGRS